MCCVVEGRVKKLTKKRWKKWLINLRLRSGGADQCLCVQMIKIRYNNISIKTYINRYKVHSVLKATNRHNVNKIFAVQRASLIIKDP